MTSRNGFSIIELIVAIGISAGVIFMVGALSNNLSQVANFVNLKLQNRQNIDLVFEGIARELRSAGPSSLGAYAIASASSTLLSFYSDLDKDGLFERVRYFVGTSTIEKGVIKPSGNPLAYATSSEIVVPVLVNVLSSSSAFRYFDDAYTGTQAPMPDPVDVLRIRLIEISATVDINPGQTPTPTVFSRTVNVRNLRTN
ncbi:hypothetical protein C4587_01195 [Candidatus Parcubacteria bacterium]|nr:MAG: hypothetical protein C4587_01195 [Candidatus Parcubacteria bacterium]